MGVERARLPSSYPHPLEGRHEVWERTTKVPIGLRGW
jgi:hypothetical protein